MIAGVGSDVVELSRFTSFGEKDALLAEVLTPREIQALPRDAAKDSHVATTFAIKEAFFKALGTGVPDASFWHDIEITADRKVYLSGRLELLARMKSLSAIHVTASRSSDTVYAFVVLESVNHEEVL